MGLSNSSDRREPKTNSHARDTCMRRTQKTVNSGRVALRTMLLLFLFSWSVQAQTATITWGTTYQTIQGFGVSNHGTNAPALTSAQSTFLFSQTSGIGLSLLRTGVTEDGSCTSVSSSCAQNEDPASDLQACVANGCQVIAAPWTPPASMKTNGNLSCNAGAGNGTLASGSFGTFATYLSNYITSLSTYLSVPLYAISVQNEPDICAGYDSSLFSAAQIDTFVKTNLGPTLSANGQGSVQIVIPDSSQYGLLTTYAGTCMGDSSCSQYVGITAFHAYDAPTTINNPYSTPLWMTEISAGSDFGPQTCSGGSWCPTISDALYWASEIDSYLSQGLSAWFWFDTQQNCSNNDCNEGLYNYYNGGQLAIRAYAIGNWSKFVRPGWVRMDATHAPQSGVSVSAYSNTSTGNFAIVVINQNGSDVSQTFTLNQFTSVASVTPWVTSASLSLAQQSDVAVSGGTFSYTLPADSVTTFVAPAGNISSTPRPPTNLAATIR